MTAAAGLEAQIRGPMLGYVFDARQESIRPVLGIAGSSTLGPKVALDFAVRQASISPNQDFAMVVGGETRVPYLADLRAADPVVRTIDGLPPAAERAVLSPRGTAAAVLYAEPKQLLVLTGLPLNPQVARKVDLSTDGVPPLVSISDDGALVAAAFPETKSLILIDANGNFAALPDPMEVRSAAFLENSHDLLAATASGVVRIASNSIAGVLYESASVKAISSTADGKRVLIADGDSASVIELALDGGDRRQVDCPCELSAVSRISQGIFRLNEVSSAPLWLVEVADSGLRALFVPPDPAE